MSELVGMIRNGIERGWQVNEIKSSLINSGYSLQSIDLEISRLTNSDPQTVPAEIVLQNQIPPYEGPSPYPPQTAQIPQEFKIPTKLPTQSLSTYQTKEPSEKKAGNGLIITIVILLILCILAGAGLLFFL